MKIEKNDDNQITLILKSSELRERNLKLSDLSYGNVKARELLLEIIDKASLEVGFKADMPLCVEAVPLKEGDIKLIVTKIDGADELDTRYSKFTPLNGKPVPVSLMKMLEQTFDKFEEVLKIGNVKGAEQVNSVDKIELIKEEEIVCIFEFESIDKGTEACKTVSTYAYESKFFKDEKNNKYFLVLSIPGRRPQEELTDFNKACNSLAEYGSRVMGGPQMNKAYYEEHFKVIIGGDAVKKLSLL